jgi:hypothetical protein
MRNHYLFKMKAILRRVILLLSLTSAIAIAAQWPFSDPKTNRKKARMQDNNLKKNMARQ